MIELYYSTALNGHKITMFMEEMRLPYIIRPAKLGTGAQFNRAFLGGLKDFPPLQCGFQSIQEQPGTMRAYAKGLTINSESTRTEETTQVTLRTECALRRHVHRSAVTRSRGAAALLSAWVACVAQAAPAARDLTIAGASVHVDYAATEFLHGDAPLLEWVRRSGGIVAAYYARFPVSPLTLRIDALAGEGVHGGKTFAKPAAFIRVGVGREVSGAELLADWVLVHEMTHLALPDTGEEHAWLSEGLATYVEGVARVQAGNRSEADVWAEELRSMPRGLPQAEDRGLDHTHTWERTYWGGAMFCLMADVDIRRRTHNRLGLQDALRAILAASGGLSADWPIERVLRTGDAAVGVSVLEELYAQFKDTAVSPDLMQLWRQLGVEPEGDTVRLNDAAPLADIRRAIMRPRLDAAPRR